jgi:hypothetical protein
MPQIPAISESGIPDMPQIPAHIRNPGYAPDPGNIRIGKTTAISPANSARGRGGALLQAHGAGLSFFTVVGPVPYLHPILHFPFE